MTFAEALGCTAIAFGPPLWVFVVFIARDPLRIILFVLGAFFWLVSLLLSSILWYAVVPLRQTLVFGLFFSIAFQELFRYLYFFVLKRAQRGLDKLSASGMHIAGVHSLKNARHMLAVVCGLGMGTMAGMFLLVNVIADFSGEGTAGFPASVYVANVTVPFRGHGNYHFCLMSTLSAGILILTHIAWTVVFWDGCHKKGSAVPTWWVGLVIVILSHYVSSAISFYNEKKMYGLTLGVQLIILLINWMFAWYVMGGSVARMKAAFGLGPAAGLSTPRTPIVDETDESPAPTHQRRFDAHHVET
uniref:Gamma-secretase subunit Aph-1 n=1 Tax=Plectus sambesii TaxID=2011161 RepID=A0A914WNS6_9BILA